MIKNEIMLYLNNEHNWFWELETDLAKNYRYYFIGSNPKELEQIFIYGKKSQTKSHLSMLTDGIF